MLIKCIIDVVEITVLLNYNLRSILETVAHRHARSTAIPTHTYICVSIALTHLPYHTPIPHRVNESFAAKGTVVRLFNPYTIQPSTLFGPFH